MHINSEELCSNLSKISWRPSSRSWRTCGGFFDVSRLQTRLGEIESRMAQENFWNNREQAQELIDEANSIRRRIDPVIDAEKHLADFRIMVELGEAEAE